MSSRPRRRTTKARPDDVLSSEKLAAFGRNLREARLERGMLQRELAALTDLQATHISRIEGGRFNLTFRTMEKIAGALGVTINSLVGKKNGDI